MILLSLSQFVTQTRNMKELIHKNNKFEVTLVKKLEDHCHKQGIIIFSNIKIIW